MLWNTLRTRGYKKRNPHWDQLDEEFRFLSISITKIYVLMSPLTVANACPPTWGHAHARSTTRVYTNMQADVTTCPRMYPPTTPLKAFRKCSILGFTARRHELVDEPCQGAVYPPTNTQ